MGRARPEFITNGPSVDFARPHCSQPSSETLASFTVTAQSGSVRVGCALAVLAVATGILGMHGLTAGMSALSEPPAPSGGQHLVHLPTMAAERLAAVRVDPSMSPMDGRGHALAACLWILVGAISIALLGSAPPVGVSQRARGTFSRALSSAGQRGPPSSQRLSLVGVSRR